MDDYLERLIIDSYNDLAPDEAQREELAGMLEAMWRECREQRAFGYSDHQLAIAPEVPNFFRIVRPLITNKDEFQRFCTAMPAILEWMPYFSAESPVGYMHTIITGPFENRAQACVTLDEFVKGFEGYPVSVCPECGKDTAVERLEHGYSVRCTCGFFMVC
jgi:hypothetical protein